jgi:plasmid stability protein
MPATLSIKNVPDDVLDRLRDRARLHNRSLQGELKTILEEAVQPRRLTAYEVLQRVEKLGLRTSDDAVNVIREARDAR